MQGWTNNNTSRSQGLNKTCTHMDMHMDTHVHSYTAHTCARAHMHTHTLACAHAHRLNTRVTSLCKDMIAINKNEIY